MSQQKEQSGRAYADAQRAMAILKAAIYDTLLDASPVGLRNVDIGKSLGIHAGHVRHEGHIPRTLLAIMESEGVVEQDRETSLWRLCNAAGTDR